MTRHGESDNNVKNIIGGDCHITQKGINYSKKLGSFFSNLCSLSVWTSNMKRTIETSSYITDSSIRWDNLNEISSGDYDGMILTDIENFYSNQYKVRNIDKLNSSYPNGESYTDLQNRVLNVLSNINMDNDGVLLIIAHKAVCRVIYSYFTKIPLSECVDLNIDLHKLYKLERNKFSEINFSI